VVNDPFFLFLLTQVACTAPRSRLTALRLSPWGFWVSVVEVLAASSDAELLGDADVVGAGFPDAAAAVPAPPMATAAAPAIAMVFHMMSSLVGA
jgi:hypothetical protein